MVRIVREEYLGQLKSLVKTPDIKVITGIRRCGKSWLMADFIKWLKEYDPLSNIVFINLQDLQFESLKAYRTLNDYVMKQYQSDRNNYLVIDEVQLCESFELAINSIHSGGLFDIYITGSNAFLLSSDLLTLFTGRTINVEVFPFSFNEFIRYFALENPEDALDRYMLEGGMPGSYPYQNRNQKYQYIRDIFQTIILRDLVQKYAVRNIDVLEKLAYFMMDNIGNLCSANSLTNQLFESKTESSRVTVRDYIKYLCNAFVFYEARRFDLRGKAYLKSTEKYYLADHGFRFATLGTRNMDYGRVYENMVYIELLRRGYEVYVGKIQDKEVDFVATKQSEKFYIQVSDDVSRQETINRELAPLLAINDAYPKIIIARTRHETYQIDGVKIINLADWLN